MRISGKLTDVNGEPLMGANIYPVNKEGKSFGKGTITNFDGKFDYELNVDENVPIVISFLGFETLYKKPSELTGRTFIMKESAEALDEVVITYDKPQKAKLKTHFDKFGVYYAGLGLLGLALLLIKIKK